MRCNDGEWLHVANGWSQGCLLQYSAVQAVDLILLAQLTDTLHSLFSVIALARYDPYWYYRNVQLWWSLSFDDDVAVCHLSGSALTQNTKKPFSTPIYYQFYSNSYNHQHDFDGHDTFSAGVENYDKIVLKYKL